MCAQSCAPMVANYFINLNLKFQRTLRASLDLPGDMKYDDIKNALSAIRFKIQNKLQL